MKFLKLTILIILSIIAYFQQFSDVIVDVDFSSKELTNEDILSWSIKRNKSGGLISQCSENKDFSFPEEVFGLQQNFAQKTRLLKTFDTGVKPVKCWIVFDLYLYNFAYNDSVNVYAEDQLIYQFECKKINRVTVKKTQCYDKYYNQNMPVSILENIKTITFVPQKKRINVELNVSFQFQDTFWGLKNLEFHCDFNRCPKNQRLDQDSQVCICQNGFIASSQNPLTCIQPPVCHPSCLNCFTSGNVCNKCPANSELSEDKQKCVCKTGYTQKSSSPLICEHEEIKITCPSNSYLVIDLKICLCNYGYYAVSQNPLICIQIPQCHSSCLQCQKNSDICALCPDFSILTNGDTQCECPLNSSISPDGLRCECPQNSSFDLMNRQCQCKQGFQQFQSRVFICRKNPVCNASCLQCNDQEICIRCPANSTAQGKVCVCNKNYIAFQIEPLICQNIKEANQISCPLNSYSLDGVTCICYDNFFPSQPWPLLECSQINECDPTCQQCSFDGKCIKCIEDFVVNEDLKTCRDPGCHPSCNCDLRDDQCGSQAACLTCKQPTFTHMVNKDFCQCLTPQYKLKEGSEWECVETNLGIDTPVCEWQLYNQILNMVVHSNCGIEINQQQQNILVDNISFDWRRIKTATLDDKCKNELRTRILLAKDCTNYELLNSNYFTYINQTQISLRIPLIDVYQLTQNTSLTADARTIYQIACFAIELSHSRRTIRLHKFQIRVYTNRDVVEVFHLTVSKQITDGCDKGQECIIVANLDTKSDICTDSSCNAFFKQGVVPSYQVGQHMYVRIQFKDNTYKKYLNIKAVKFVDDKGIYSYVRNVQYWTLRQNLGSVDVEVFLFQPHQNALVQVELKIALNKD
ncbi:hypothetical protein IMG5_009740, partial [Ichthyophthirius multifiliis]